MCRFPEVVASLLKIPYYWSKKSLAEWELIFLFFSYLVVAIPIETENVNIGEPLV